MAFNHCVCLQYRRARQFTNISVASVSATISVANMHSALMHAKLLFTDKRSVGLMQICLHLWPSLEIFCPFVTKIKYMYTTTRACILIVNVSVIIEHFHQYSRNGNLSMLILIPTLPKPTAYFSIIFSW